MRCSRPWRSCARIRKSAIKLIAEIDELSPEVAAAEYEGNISKLPTSGAMTTEWLTVSLDLAKLVGMSDMAPLDEIFITSFKPASGG